jgi:hypothetical protein
MANWHPNNALAKLIAQWKAGNPGTEVVYTIADDAHPATSDHAEDADGTVDAGDFMPGSNVTDRELDDFAETLRLNRDRRVKYVIRRQRIFAGNDGPRPWVWRPYTGKYHGHTHVSTVQRFEDDGRDWDLTRPTTEGEDMALTETDLRNVAVHVLTEDNIIKSPEGSVNADGTPNTHLALATYVRDVHARLVRLEDTVTRIAEAVADPPSGGVDA